ncbi:hypothetical protein GOB81_12935 [Acetobacter sp. LMG 1627]|uniref:Phospholipid/glycerol acyltransferase domain-containing protein n=2 Tax=Acetobacter conturbans TaxID=1737472 RepID=A0ABX0K1F3_9PROT|nr:hypothetical protein [Acetobacter conturbans]
MRRGIVRHFNAVRLSGDQSVLQFRGPLIICSNHPGWWDPAVFAFLQHRLFRHCHGYGPIDADALRRYPLLEKAGLIPVDITDTRSLQRFFRTAQQMLKQGNILWVTPQGHFADPRTRPLNLQSGVAHLLRHVSNARVITLAIEYPFWKESRPELLLRFGSFVAHEDSKNIGEIMSRLEIDLTETMDALAHDACAQDASRFTVLTTGRAGIGGLYDLLRRVWQRHQGQRFTPRHDA